VTFEPEDEEIIAPLQLHSQVLVEETKSPKDVEESIPKKEVPKETKKNAKKEGKKDVANKKEVVKPEEKKVEEVYNIGKRPCETGKWQKVVIRINKCEGSVPPDTVRNFFEEYETKYLLPAEDTSLIVYYDLRQGSVTQLTPSLIAEIRSMFIAKRDLLEKKLLMFAVCIPYENVAKIIQAGLACFETPIPGYVGSDDKVCKQFLIDQQQLKLKKTQ